MATTATDETRVYDLPLAESCGKYCGLRLTELAHLWTLDGRHDDELGSVDECGEWHALIDGGLDTEDVTGLSFGPTSDELDWLAEQVGCIVTEDSQGFVGAIFFDNHDALSAVWDRLSSAHSDTWGD